MAQSDKIDRTIMRSLDMVEKLEKLFANNGAFEQAVAEIGGDIGWFGDVRENLKTLYSNIEELHMGAVSHMDMEEAAKPMKKAAKDKEANESLNYLKKLAGIAESDEEEDDDDDDKNLNESPASINEKGLTLTMQYAIVDFSNQTAEFYPNEDIASDAITKYNPKSDDVYVISIPDRAIEKL
jgi:uncharacterized protein YfcZ (UPF0381/DUF406 family)